MSHPRGFTLIELLIVVAIIGILAVSLMPTISDAPARARDAARKSMLNSIITHIESFNIDKGHYPRGAENWTCLNAVDGKPDLALLINDYLKENNTFSSPVPHTIHEQCQNSFLYKNEGLGYSIATPLEIKNGTTLPGGANGEPIYFVIER